MEAIDFLNQSKVHYIEIKTPEQLLEQRKNFGYYFIFDTSGRFELEQIDKIKLIKFLKYEELCSITADLDRVIGPDCYRRIKAADARHYLNIQSDKKFYAIELDTVASFKEHKNVWIIHEFDRSKLRDQWVLDTLAKGNHAKAIKSKDRLQHIKKPRQLMHFAAINPKGVKAPAGDPDWMVYRFDNRAYRNQWVREKNAQQRIAIMLPVADVHKYARIKHSMPIKTNSKGLVLSDDSNRRTSTINRRYYLGVNSKGLNLPANDPNWVIYAGESLATCNALIESFNSKGEICAKKIDRVFAYKVLGLDVSDHTELDENNMVCTYDSSFNRKLIA